MKKQFIICIAAFTILFTGFAKAQPAWITDFDAAVSDSKNNNKDLLIVFTGSDWNDQSKDLIANVFTEDFFNKASKDYVLCNIDIVQDETLMDQNSLEKNYKIASLYGVQTLPYFILQTAEGDVYASTGPTETTVTADSLLAYLASFGDVKKKLTDFMSLIKSTKGVERAVNIDRFIDTLNPANRDKYADLIREVPDLDADGKANLKGKFQLMVAYLDAISLYKNSKMVEAGDIFLKLAEGGTLNPSQSQEAWYMGAYLYAMSKTVDNSKIIDWLNKAIAADPENEGTAQIRETIEQLQNSPPNAAEADTQTTPNQ